MEKEPVRKKKRQNKIRELIVTHNVATQEELQDLLRKVGFTATQATISRDIKDLRLVKTLSPTGGYYYTAVPQRDRDEVIININSIFMESVRSIDFAGNIVVVKCFTGMANAVCATIDTGTWEGMVGTIAGDDTIFLLLRTEQQAEEFAQYLRTMVRRGS